MPPKAETSGKWTVTQSLKLAMVLIQAKSPNLAVSDWNNIEKLLTVLFDSKITLEAAKNQWKKLKKTYMEGGGQQVLDDGLLEAAGTAAPSTSKKPHGKPAGKKDKNTESISADAVMDENKHNSNEDNDESDLDLLNTDDESDTKPNNDKQNAEFNSGPKPKTNPISKSKSTTKAQDKGRGKGKAIAKSSSATSARPNKKRSTTHPTFQNEDAGSAAVTDDETNPPPSKKSRYLADGTPKNASNDLDTFLSTF